jgi:hypothetical protein
LSKRLIVLLAAFVALAAIAAGCGSSDDNSTDTVEVDVTVTKAELIKQGDTICKQGNTEIEEGFEQYADENNIPKDKEPSDEQGVEIVETVIVPNLKTQSELIRGIGAPEGDEEQIEEMLDSLDQAIEEAEDDPESLFNEDTDPFGDANEKAQAYGFSECGED